MKFKGFIAFLVLCVGLYAGKQLYDLDNRKILYLHVGPHKTGTTSLQVALHENREALRQKGLYYPSCLAESRWPESHNEMAFKVKEGLLDLVLDRLKQIEIEVGDCKAILLSAEEFSNSHISENYEKFLAYLDQQFQLKIIYCLRDTGDRIASMAAHSACSGPLGLVPFGIIKDYARGVVHEEKAMISFYVDHKAKFLFFKDLVAHKNLIGSFLKEGVGLDMELPNKQVNTREAYFLESQKVDVPTVQKLEPFFGVKPDTLVKAYFKPDDQGKLFISTIHAIAKKEVNDYVEKAEQIIPVSFSAESYMIEGMREKHWKFWREIITFFTGRMRAGYTNRPVLAPIDGNFL
jgi:hypothetical protein